MKEALYWNEAGTGLKCGLCPHECALKDGQTGICRVRVNKEGVLYTQNYGKISSMAVDPTEKKPLFHFHPGSLLLSIGSYGCNLRCEFCQNWTISQEKPKYVKQSPREVVEAALGAQRKDRRMVGIAYTYNEPSVMYEFVLECAKRARAEGLKNVFVTNGYLNLEPLKGLLPFLDGINIDVKGFSPEFYRKVIGGELCKVKEAVETAANSSWVEVTYLVIPGLNDSKEEVREMARWLRGINPKIPLHLSRYFPNYRMNVPATPLETLVKLKKMAEEYLEYVYVGNAWQKGLADTVCPDCGSTLITRGALTMESSYLTPTGECRACGRPLDVVGKVWV